MDGRPSAAPTLSVQRRYEFARLQQQLLSLAYEHLLPIVRPQPRTATAASRPPRNGRGGCPRGKEALDYASV
jgi:hypothetical protein